MTVSWFLCRLLTGHDASFCHRAVQTGRGLFILVRLCGEAHVNRSYALHEIRKWTEDNDGTQQPYGLSDKIEPQRRA